MKNPKRFLTAVFLLLGLAACTVPTPQPAAPTIPPTPALLLTATSAPAFTVVPRLDWSADLLKNMTYTSPSYQENVTLVNGSYERTEAENSLRVNLYPQIAFGDLNGDGSQDAAVALAENGGGTGTFVSLVAVLNQDGVPVQSASVLIDDRPLIKDIAIQDSRIVLQATIHGVNDPFCCPTLEVVETYRLSPIPTLDLVRFTSLTSDGRERAIHIESPAAGSAVQTTLQVSGSMPIGPFENNLKYTIYDPKNTPLAVGPFPVSAANPGDPATFSNSITIQDIAAGTHIRFELTEESMADGSTLALDSVDLLVK